MTSTLSKDNTQPKHIMKASRASPTILPQPAPKRQKISTIKTPILPPSIKPPTHETITFAELEPDIIARVHHELSVDINSPYSQLTDLGKAALIGHLHEKDEHIRRLAYLEICRSSPTWEGRVRWIRQELARRAPEMVGEFYKTYKVILPPAKKKVVRKMLKGADKMGFVEGTKEGYSNTAKEKMEKSASLLAKATAKAAADNVRKSRAELTPATKMLLQSSKMVKGADEMGFVEGTKEGYSNMAKEKMEKSASLLAKATAKAAVDSARTSRAKLTPAAKMLLQSPNVWKGADEGMSVSHAYPPVAATQKPAPQKPVEEDDDVEITAVKSVRLARPSTPKATTESDTKKEEIDLTITPNPKIQVLIPSYTPTPKSTIMIRLKYSKTESMPFRMKRTTIFSHLMTQALKKLNAEMHREFTFKGKLLLRNSTPHEVGMEEGDVIELHWWWRKLKGPDGKLLPFRKLVTW